jgi:hypothetical protein
MLAAFRLAQNLTEEHVLLFAGSATVDKGDRNAIGRGMNTEVNGVVEYWDDYGIHSRRCLTDRD